ncbi:MAG: adenosylcobinamide-GDP ribazoletransferase [Pseudomonadota bacterium]
MPSKHEKMLWPLVDIWRAGILLTRLPLPPLPTTAFANSAQAAWAYPLIGVLLAAGAGATGLAFMALGLPTALVAGLALTVMTLVTGALHEDGLADVADGFWGGYACERRLEIMRDSQIGSYGVLALIISTGLRWGALAMLLPTGLAAFVASAALSRAMMPCLMYALPHARQDGLSQQVGRPSRVVVAVGLLFAAFASFALLGAAASIAIAAALLVTLAMGHLARQKIGGQTGDVLGATQVLSETAALLGLAALLT